MPEIMCNRNYTFDGKLIVKANCNKMDRENSVQITNGNRYSRLDSLLGLYLIINNFF